MLETNDYRNSPKAPDVLRLRADGTLYCTDGTAPQDRLRELYGRIMQTNAGADMPVCVMHRDGYATMAFDAWLCRNGAA